jgi:hypothetical protein
MTHRVPGRKSALLGLSATALLVLGMLSPAAHAQVPGVDSPVNLPGSGGGGSGGSGGGSGNDTGGTVGSVVDTVVDVTDKTTDPDGDIVGDTGGTVGKVVENTGGAVGSDPIEDAGKTIGNTSKGAGDTTTGVRDGIDRVVRDTGGGLLDPDLLIDDPRDPKSKRPDSNQGSGPHRSRSGSGPREVVKGDRFTLGANGSQRSNPKLGSLEAAEAKSRRQSATLASASAPVPARETFITQLADAAVEATKKLAFPLGLALMVGAFLMVQGRIDRKDAKLVLAPISSEQDLLSFQ